MRKTHSLRFRETDPGIFLRNNTCSHSFLFFYISFFFLFDIPYRRASISTRVSCSDLNRISNQTHSLTDSDKMFKGPSCLQGRRHSDGRADWPAFPLRQLFVLGMYSVLLPTFAPRPSPLMHWHGKYGFVCHLYLLLVSRRILPLSIIIIIIIILCYLL